MSQVSAKEDRLIVSDVFHMIAGQLNALTPAQMKSVPMSERNRPQNEVVMATSFR